MQWQHHRNSLVSKQNAVDIKSPYTSVQITDFSDVAISSSLEGEPVIVDDGWNQSQLNSGMRWGILWAPIYYRANTMTTNHLH